MKTKCLLFISLFLLGGSSVLAQTRTLKLAPNKISLAKGITFNLNLPDEFEVAVAAEGLKRVRFMAMSPDNRVFVTDMYNLADNKRGAVYILEDFDERSGRFGKVTPYLTNLRNPNSICFHSDAEGNSWFYLALTDQLVRYRYRAGDNAPRGRPQVLAEFPDYGLGYKYGGWHLTRTVAYGPNGKLYVSVGSSCNACEEKEEIRATVIEMNPDGSGRRLYATGLRNAVGLKWVGRELYATNMGADHLGRDKPSDTMYVVRDGASYGWPYCYQQGPRIYADPQFGSSAKNTGCRNVPAAFASFPAHSSPLGLEYFDASTNAVSLKNNFLVALHGSSIHRMDRGHSIVRVRRGGRVEDFVTGFMQNGKLYGRPADIMKLGADAFLFTDDYNGVVYYVRRKGR
ncbi:MAG TPA: PQQ-dependent sugar dehydrogenase [Pyrinomonadaceae bacterium]|nr:PQQ-dependent sugar dehydrogenase [Pyrinomonadaceae bacterium]